MKRFKLAATVVGLIGLVVSACAPVGPDFVKPEPEASEQWSESSEEIFTNTDDQLHRWWEVFNDPILNQLVETARANNNGLEIAGLRVLEARAQLGIATGSLYPGFSGRAR